MKGWTPKTIRRLRAAAGLTQRQLADWLGVMPMHVSHLEQGIRPAGRQTARLLDILAERLKAGDEKAVQPKKQRGKR